MYMHTIPPRVGWCPDHPHQSEIKAAVGMGLLVGSPAWQTPCWICPPTPLHTHTAALV